MSTNRTARTLADYREQALADLPSGIAWHGTRDEALRLQVAMDTTCRESDTPCAWDWINEDCAAQGLMSSQRVLHGLVFARLIADRLIAQEMTA